MSRVIVVGSGIAGLTAALVAGSRHQVSLVTKADLAESNTRYAQGGIAAAVSDDDTVEEHIADTLRVGGGLNELDAVRALCAEGPERIRDLIRFGVAFDRSNGRLARGLEAAHSTARVLHAGGDATGAAIGSALIRAVQETDVRILEHSLLTDLILDDERVVGIEMRDAAGVTTRLDADAVILASGGAGRLYRHTTNPVVATGDGAAAAWRAGAQLVDLEFYQFHPTALVVPGSFLISEAVRGEGAVLRNAAGHRFMVDVHPDAELAPRDVVARAIAVEMAAQDGTPVMLDATGLGAEFLTARFPTIAAACRQAGYDWARQPVPVTPAAHYWMGGVATDLLGRTSLPGLYAAGEVACTGAHGANRLASNSLLESVVFAHRSARALDAAGPWPAAGIPSHRRDGQEPASENTGFPPGRNGTPGASALVDRSALQELMWDAAGLYRSGARLEGAAEVLAGWRPASAEAASIADLENRNLLELARLVVDAALQRRESRGAHFRTDFPHPVTEFARHQARTREVPVPC